MALGSAQNTGATNPSPFGAGTLQLPVAERIAAQLVRALRGRRSCAEHSRRLGYASNIVRRWESAECFPTAAVFLRAHAQTHPQIRRAFGEFLKRSPEWLDARDPFAHAGITALLRDLRGKTPIGVLAARTGLNRYSIGRWLKGSAQPKLPELLCLVEAATLRLLDFVATLVDPSRVPALAGEWHKLRRAREVAYDAPWSHAVLRALELDAYQQARPSVASALLASQLGLPGDEVERGLRALAESGQIKRARGKWQVERVLAVDTSADPERSRALKHAWTRVAAERLERGAPGNYGYSVFAISKHGLGQLKELHLQYVRAMQSLIAESEPAECVGLYCTQLLDLGAVAPSMAPPRGA